MAGTADPPSPPDPKGRGLEPFLSVLIVAHGRTQFVAEALESVRRQRLDRTAFEILLATDQPTPSIRAAARDSGARLSTPPSGHWGEWVLDLTDAARGEVLCFLDDDDLFHEDKLAEVRRVFGAHPKLEYYHNAVVPFGEAGSGVAPPRDRRPYGPDRGLLQDVDKATVDAESLFWAGGGFNASAIAVRRELVRAEANRLRAVERSHSLALFYLALLRSSDLYFDGRPWTRYRLHSENWSATRGAPLREQWGRLARDAPPILRDVDRIRSWIEEGDRPWLRSEAVRSIGARAHLVASITPGPSTRRSRASLLASYLRLSPRSVVWGQRGLVGVAALSLLARGWAARWVASSGR